MLVIKMMAVLLCAGSLELDAKGKHKDRVPLATIQVRGMVKDDKGIPLAGVSVSIAGQRGGVSTDDKGNFSISVSETAELSFSFVGFKTITFPVQGKSRIKITLSAEASSLDDVVVVGFGTQKKVTVTGAISVHLQTQPLFLLTFFKQHSN